MPIEYFAIESHRFGQAPAFLIAEVAQAHDGSLGLAHAYIDAAADAGANAVKFQTHIAAAESTLDEPFRVRFSLQDATRFDYWRRMEFSDEQWAGLADHARARGLAFLSSPFSVDAVELLERVGVAAWKIASGELGSEAILAAMLATHRPFIVSSGMSAWADIDAMVERIRNGGRDLAVLQCTSRYPTPLDAVGLNVIEDMRRRYGVPVGLSDHSGSIWPAIAAIVRGADIVELHLTLDRRMFGPDTLASLTVEEFKLVRAARDAFAVMDAHPVDKDRVAAELAPMRAMFGRSLAPRRPLAAGTVLAAEMLTAKKPGTGIAPSGLPRLIGRRLCRDVCPERLLTWKDVE